MNYNYLYERIIENRKNKTYEGYTEKHHIIPKSLGGSNNFDNIVKLSAREHFLCHYLLAKMYKQESNEWYKMQFAFNMMKQKSFIQQRYFNSRLYEALRNDWSLAMSNFAKNNFNGSGNSQYDTIWISNCELKQNRKISKDSKIPDNWCKGRNKWKQNEKNKVKELEKEKELKEKKKLIEFYWDEFKRSNLSTISEFMKITTYPYSRISLIKSFKKIFQNIVKCLNKEEKNMLRSHSG